MAPSSAYRPRWSSLTLPLLVLLCGTFVFGYRILTPTLPFSSGKDLRHVGHLFHSDVPLQRDDKMLQLDGRTPDDWTRESFAALDFLQPDYHLTFDRNGEIRTVEVLAEHIPFHLAMLWWGSPVALGLAALIVSALIGLFSNSGLAEQSVRLSFLGMAMYMLCAMPLIGAPPLSWIFEPLLIPLQIVSIGLTSGVVVFFLAYPRPARVWRPYMLPLVIYAISIMAGTIALVLSADDILVRSSMVSRQIVNGMATTHTVLALGLGFRAYRMTTDNLVRTQFRWIFWGGIAGVTPWLCLWGLPILLFDRPFVSFFSIVVYPLLAVPISFTFALLRLRLLDVDVMLRRTLVTILVFVCFGVMYGLLVASVQQHVPAVLPQNDMVLLIVLVVIVTIVFLPPMRVAQTFIDRLFYYERHMLQREIEALVLELRQIEGWETLEPLLNQRIPRQLKLSHAQILVQHNGYFAPPTTNGQHLMLDHPSDETAEPPALQVYLPSDWPLDRPAVLQQWRASSGNGQHFRDALPRSLEWTKPLFDAGYDVVFVLVAGGQPVGIYALGQQLSGDWYERSTVNALGMLADRLAREVKIARLLDQAAAQARLRHELMIARHIQQSLLPRTYLRQGRLEVAVRTLAASDVGGDFYAMHPLHNDGLAAAAGDSSGKGVGAALLMAVTSAMLNTLIQEGDPPARLLTRLDTLLRGYIATYQQSVALCYLHLYAQGPAKYQLLAASAGAIPILVRRADGCTEWLYMEGLPLGSIIEYSTYRPVTTTLQPGDTLIICTDGITEARDPQGELLSFDGVEQMLAELPNYLGAQAILQHLMTAVQRYTQRREIEDDVTLMVICFR